MSETPDPDPNDPELLLPWLATGRLDPATTTRLDSLLATDEELRRRLGLVRDELGETVRLNEALGAPSTRAADALFRRIDADVAAPTPALRRARWSWLRGLLVQPNPRILGWAAAAAMLLILAQASGIALLLEQRGAPATYETASGPTPGASGGSYALIGFTPAATAAQIDALLQELHASIVDGPRGGGLYRVRISDATLDVAGLNAALARLRQNAGVIRLVLPSK